MIIIGEKLNSSIPSTLDAIQSGDAERIKSIILAQAEAGADFLDINTALCGENELSEMIRLIDMVREYTECGIVLDSPSTDIIASAIASAGDRPVILNSVTLTERIDELIPVALKYGASVIALPMDDDGIPEDAEKRTEIALKIVDKLTSAGVPKDKIYIDILVQSVAVEDTAAKCALETLVNLKKADPDVKTVCGLSNVSFGLPKRININSAFMNIAVWCGLDSAIFDPSSQAMMNALRASEAVCAMDEFCIEYIGQIRKYM